MKTQQPSHFKFSVLGSPFSFSSLLACLVFALAIYAVPALRRPDYWLALIYQNFPMAALALALTPIILTGGIDLSIASTTVLASIVVRLLAQDLGWPIEWAILGGFGVGLLCGIINGGLVVLGVLPLVATLATRELYRGLASSLIGDRQPRVFPPELRGFWHTHLLGLPLPLFVLGFLFIITYLLAHHTRVGRAIYALGDNEQAARFAGLPIRCIKWSLYVWSGLVAALCGTALVLEYGAPKADAERSLELAAIACVVLGGVRITGGSGHVAGTLLGAITLIALLAAFRGASANLRDILTGTLLIVVALANEAGARWTSTKFQRQS